ncbi:MAG: beta-propeller fold lactonase family protein [Nibricoccus sp.]
MFMTSAKFTFARSILLSLGLLALPLSVFAHDDDRHSRDVPEAVYTISNATDGNRVLTFSRNAHGELTHGFDYPTGGLGTGGSLGNQGALAMTNDGRWLITVNAGSHEISVFSVREHALVLTDIVPSGGKRPISVTVADNLVYVLNAGGAAGASDNISGFYLTEHGRLYAVPGSTRSLSGPNVGPAQISFGPRGDVLIVVEKATNLIDSFVVDDDGRAGPAISTPSAGATPFGFSISSKGYLFVSEAVQSALSSYKINANGTLTLVTPSLVNHQAAACWVVLSRNEKFAYTANAASNSISGYKIAPNGEATLLDATGLTAATDAHPLDMTVTNDGKFLYSLDTTAATIVGFRTNADGGLTRVSSFSGLPSTATGLVAR